MIGAFQGSTQYTCIYLKPVFLLYITDSRALTFIFKQYNESVVLLYSLLTDGSMTKTYVIIYY